MSLKIGRIVKPFCYLGAFGVMVGASAIASADPTAYVITSSDHFGTIDLSTGSASMIGNMGQLLSGLGESSSGNLYGGGWLGGGFYKIDASTGSLTLVGTSSITYLLTGSTANGTVYAIGLDQNLYTVNTSSGVASLVGATGISIPDSGPYSSMSDGSNGLFVTSNNQLYSLNLTTGAASAVGTGMGGSLESGAMVEEGGTLYAGIDVGGASSLPLYTVNETSGLATAGPNSTGMDGNFWGLAPSAPPAPTPEPVTICLGIGGLALAARRRFVRTKN